MKIVILVAKEHTPSKTIDRTKGPSGERIVTGGMIAFSEPDVKPIVASEGDNVFFDGIAVDALTLASDLLVVVLEKEPNSVMRFKNPLNGEAYLVIQGTDPQRGLPSDAEIIYTAKKVNRKIKNRRRI